MALAKRVLVDTSAFYALVASDDAFHQQARHIYERLIDWDQELWTTSYILVETIALVHHRLGFETLKGLIDPLQGILHLFWVEPSVHNEAWRELVTRQGGGLSFVDWTTALAAKRLRAHVFTFDEGFDREGVPVIR